MSSAALSVPPRRRWRVALGFALCLLASCSGRSCGSSATDADGKAAPAFRNLGKRGDSNLPARP